MINKQEQLLDIKEGELYCVYCKERLGSFIDKKLRVASVLNTREGKVFLSCSKCGTEVYICKNNLDVTLMTDKKI